MNVIPTGFEGLLVLEPKILSDSRGYFMESFNKKTLLSLGIDIPFVQDNQSSSKKGVLRGLHFQKPPYEQTKLVRVLSGAVVDVVVDLRKSQPTYGKHFSIELSAENKKQLLVPKGFAHGFVVTSEMAEVLYKCDEYYNPQADAGINYRSINFDWKFSESELVLSDKDRNLPLLQDANFQF